MDLWTSQPDDARNEWSSEDVTDYAGRSGDLANAVNATASNAIADLGTGNTYEVSSSIDTDSIVGLAGEDCTIVVNMEGIVLPMGGSGNDVVALQGVTFDLSETVDASILTTYGAVQDHLFVKDVTIEGKRGRQVNDGGQSHTFLVQVGPQGEAFVENFTATDGSTEVSGQDRGYAIGAGADPRHEGYAVWKDCDVRQFMGNGYYMQNAPGTSVLWNCKAVNNALTNMRLGADDIVIGGRAEVNSDYPYTEQVGTLLGGNGDQWGDVVGLTLVAEGDMWGSAGIRTWTGGSPGGEGGSIRNSTFHIRSGSAPAFRIHSDRNPNLELEDVMILDESGSSNTFDIADWVEDRSNAPGTVTLNGGVQIDANTGTTFQIGDNGTLTVPDGTDYTDTDLDAADIGVDATLTESDFPNYYFDYGDGDNGGGGDPAEWLDLGTDDEYSDVDNESGVLFWLKEDIGSIEARLSQNTDGQQTAYLRDSDADVVTQTDISNLSAGDTFVLAPSEGIDGSNTYSVTVDADGDHWDRGEDSSPNYEYEDDSVEVTYGVFTSGQSTTENVRYAVSEIAARDEVVDPDWLELGLDDDQSNPNNESGVLFWLQEDIDGIEARISQNTEGHRTAYLRDSGANVVTQTDISNLNAGDTFVLSPAGGIEGSNTYSVTVDADGDHWLRGEDSSPNFDYEDDIFQVTYGVYTSGQSTTENVRYAVNEIRDL
ncbi:hypothetical protein C482_18979 [Natrialba chahannaoensis JCM 10990]|uniref:Uncharacterized protein n=1 Tax=Natrialba chahannaoensis JCM 10990 TaxID=1227492 RepID=M0A6R3_9EURY|nr:hypothetical protein [Natrialba chahannaoensis]ELY94036.1 hypothetical protein C482_18979 [Natrialba chahannaoensis JCM 10990]